MSKVNTLELIEKIRSNLAQKEADNCTVSTKHRKAVSHYDEIEALANKHIATYLPETKWIFTWNKAISSLGYCSYRNKTISLSKAWCSKLPIEEIEDTILHEIAHALTPGHGHDNTWKKACIKVGANPNRLYEGDISREDIATPKYKMVTHDGVILKKYYRKPSYKVYARIKNYYQRGRKAETIGKVKIVPVSTLDGL